MTSNVPMPTFSETGFNSPAESDILAGVIADFVAAFGGALNPSLATPQGQLATVQAALIASFNDVFAAYVSQCDPAFATGRMQDAIARIYFLTRDPATSTTVNATCSGATGSVIPVSALAIATDGTIYAALQSGTIGAGGSVTIPFAAITSGPIACPAGSLNQIYRAVAGWDSVTNAADGVQGTNQESPFAFEKRRQATVAQNSAGTAASVRGWLLGNKVDGSQVVPNIIDAYVYDNGSSGSVTVGGVSIAANSLYIGVYGGADADIANAILQKKAPGCGLVGSTSITVHDTNSGYLTPPAYTIKFQRVSTVAINYAVQIQNVSDVPADYLAQITAAIAAGFPPQQKIGQAIYALASAGAVASLGTWSRLVSITANSGAEQAININQIAILGTVTVTLV